MKGNQNNNQNGKNKNCGNKNCGNKNCGKNTENSHSYQNGGNND